MLAALLASQFTPRFCPSSFERASAFLASGASPLRAELQKGPPPRVGAPPLSIARCACARRPGLACVSCRRLVLSVLGSE